MRTGDGSSCLTLKTSRKESPLLLSLNAGLVKYVESSATFHLISALAETMRYPWMIILEVVKREGWKTEDYHSAWAVILYMPGPRHTNPWICLTHLTLLKQISPQKPIKTFSKGLHWRAISYKETRARSFRALDEKMCSILFSVDLSLSGCVLGTDADKNNFSLIWWKSDILSDMVTVL